MQSELLALIEYYEKEKGIDRPAMVEALEGALLSASRKSIGPARELEVKVNPQTGETKAFATLIAMEEVTKPWDHIQLEKAKLIKPDAVEGDEITVNLTPKDFGRIAAQTARQALMQRIRQHEKELIYDQFKDRAGDIVSGTVRRFEKSDVMIDLGKFEGKMPQRERVATEDYTVGDRLRAYVLAVENTARGPEIILSRSHPNFVRRLFEAEVSEIADRTVEIRSIAREAGYRTKIAVYSADEKVDPVGACVGLRGARVKNIVKELNNEKVDIIKWSEDMDAFIRDALKPAKLRNVDIDEEKKHVRVTVDEEELSKAIGRRGQNVRLTNRLLGWEVEVRKDESAHEAFERKVMEAAEELSSKLGLDEDTSMSLVRNGLPNLEAVVEVEPSDIADLLDMEEGRAEKIHNKAKEIFEKDANSEEGE